MDPVVELEQVTKRFGAVTALNDVSLKLYPGEVHMLLGENGAGKSTLVKLLAGTLSPDQGTMRIRGAETRHHSPANARRVGINVVLQDFSLAPTLRVYENLFLGRESRRLGLLRRAEMRRIAGLELKKLGAKIDPRIEAGDLPRAEQQLVEIVKALIGVPGVLLLDEPTAAISAAESSRLFEVVERVKRDGWAILYITHRMDEVRRLGDRVTVLREGQSISSHALDDVTDEQLIRDMVGRELSAIYPPKGQAPGEIALSLNDVWSVDNKVQGVSLSVRSGEIVGVAGLVGCGKSELAQLAVGMLESRAGSVTVGSRDIPKPNPRTILSAGVGFMPEDRHRDALALERSVTDNMTLEVLRSRDYSPFGFVRARRLRTLAVRLADRLDIRPRDVTREVDALSGGNQQKVVLARALARPRKAFIMVEPTSGVDIGARQEIYGQMRALCDAGAAILMVSSDLEEVVGVSDRVYVMHGGHITAELANKQITQEAVVAGAFGQSAVPS